MDWKDALPETLKADPNITKYKSLEELAKGHVESVRLIGSSIRPLGQTATAEEKRQFVEKLLQMEPALVYAPDGDEEASKRLFRKLGRPEKPEEYVFDEAQVTAAGLKTEELRALAVTGGLTKQQAAALAKVMVDSNLEVKRVQTLERQALDMEWGAAKEERALAAKAAAMKVGLNEQEVNALTPKQLRAFYAVSKAIGVNESEFRNHDSRPTPTHTPEEAKAELDKIMARPEYFRPQPHQMAVHEQLKVEVQRLMKQAYPGL